MQLYARELISGWRRAMCRTPSSRSRRLGASPAETGRLRRRDSGRNHERAGGRRGVSRRGRPWLFTEVAQLFDFSNNRSTSSNNAAASGGLSTPDRRPPMSRWFAPVAETPSASDHRRSGAPEVRRGLLGLQSPTVKLIRDTTLGTRSAPDLRGIMVTRVASLINFTVGDATGGAPTDFRRRPLAGG